MDARSRRQVAGVVLLLSGAAAASVFLSPAGLLGWLSRFAADPVRFGVLLLGFALLRPVLAWPTTLLAIGAGYGYGIGGLPLALGLITITTLPPFLLARRASAGRIGAAGERFFAATGDLRGVVAARLVPAPSDAVSAAAGVGGVGTGAFVLGTAAGELPWAVAGVVAGDAMGTLSTRGLEFGIPLLVGAVALAIVLLAGPTYRYLRVSRVPVG